MTKLSNKYVDFEKLDFKIRMNEADLNFLQSCQQNNLILPGIVSILDL